MCSKHRTTTTYGHTFFSEMDVQAVTPTTPETPAGPDRWCKSVTFAYELDTSRAPDLKEMGGDQVESGD